MMKIKFLDTTAAIVFAAASVLATFGNNAIGADDVVDLRGKQGYPKDLKKYDPAPPALHYKEPPSPPAKQAESQTHPPEPSHPAHHDRGPEHPKSDVKVPGPDHPAFRRPITLPKPVNPL